MVICALGLGWVGVCFVLFCFVLFYIVCRNLKVECCVDCRGSSRVVM